MLALASPHPRTDSQNSSALNVSHSSAGTRRLRGRWEAAAVRPSAAYDASAFAVSRRASASDDRPRVCSARVGPWQERKATLRSLSALGSVSCGKHVILRDMSLSVWALGHMTVTQTEALRNAGMKFSLGNNPAFVTRKHEDAERFFYFENLN